MFTTADPTIAVFGFYTQVGDFPVSRGPPSVPLTQIFFKAQNLCKAGIICITKNVPNFLWFVDDFEDGML